MMSTSAPREPHDDDRRARLVAWGAWFAGLVAALWLVWTHGPRFPYQDDFALVGQLTGKFPVTWRWLWGGYNDHRYALSWLILYLTHKAAGGEHRVAMSLIVTVLAAAAALLLVALRRARGRTSAWDGAIALSWLHWGHWWNLLMSFQLWVALSTAIVGAWIACAADPRVRLTRGKSAALVACLVALPFLAGSGALSTPPLAVAALALAAWTWLDRARGSRGAALALGVGALVSLGVFAAYVQGFERSFNEANDDRLSAQLVTLGQFVGLSVGPSLWPAWAAPAAFAVAMALSAAALLARAIVREPATRGRSIALLGALGVVASLSVGIAWGRTAVGANLGHNVRYVTLLLPLTALAYLAWELHGSPRTKHVARAAIGLATLFGVANGMRDGWRGASALAEKARAFEQDVDAGMTSAELATRHAEWMFPQGFDLARTLAELRRVGLPPFDRRDFPADIDARAVGPFASFDPQPSSGAPLKRVFPRDFGGREVASLGEPGELVWRVRPGELRLAARYGLLPEAARKSDGLEFVVELRATGRETRELFSIELEPVSDVEVQPENTLELTVRVDHEGELALVTRNRPGKHDRWDRAYWADVKLR